jgi:hypothetical protein
MHSQRLDDGGLDDKNKNIIKKKTLSLSPIEHTKNSETRRSLTPQLRLQIGEPRLGQRITTQRFLQFERFFVLLVQEVVNEPGK